MCLEFASATSKLYLRRVALQRVGHPLIDVIDLVQPLDDGLVALVDIAFDVTPLLCVCFELLFGFAKHEAARQNFQVGLEQIVWT